MSTVKIHDMRDKDDEYFVGTCTHVNDTPEHLLRKEIDTFAKRRITWLRNMYKKGSRVKIASINNDQVGFLHIMPIEICPWGPVGRDLMVIPCLTVMGKANGRGIGRALINSAEEEAKGQGRKGIISMGYYHNHWFMPAPFYEKCGFSMIKRKGTIAILGKFFEESTESPQLLKPNFRFKPIAGKVVVDLFWNTFCPTSDIEAQRVHEVTVEFGDSVVVHEYCADERSILSRYQIPRGIFINGKEIWWGHEAPKEGIRETISQALRHNK
ncbi:N-acetyltransferase [Candidatus Atribacteria bacterium 1244-E10-H5-B2]|nr:MAG: N-acetyltransferase [Candidatus Atribacteria bacterium 1244-E10-H5-B2]